MRFFITLCAVLHAVSTRKILILIAKTVIVSVSVFFIYRKVISRPDFAEMMDQVLSGFQNPDHQLTLIALFLLLPVNWMLEVLKWKLLLKKIEPVSLPAAFRSVLSGVTVSLFTPNRVGEFAGRILHLRSGYRIKSAIASVIGSMNQLLITIIAGSIGLAFSLNDYLNDHPSLRWVLVIVISISVVSLLYAYFRIRVLATLSENFAFLRKLSLYTRIFEIYTNRELLQVTLYSAFRYLVFSFQFWLALSVFGINLSFTETLRLVSLVYLVMAVVPTVALSELTVRGSVALYFFTPVAGNSAGILAGSTLLWVVNLVLPAFFGALAVFYLRLNREP